jgi:CubicO group peptidase (beta-lactamase class C family)
MKKILLSVVITLSSFVAIAQPSDAYILHMMSAANLPGLEIAIVKDSKLVWERTWGYANLSDSVRVNTNNIFMMASVSKTVTETAIMKLWQEHKFKLDDNISRYLPFNVVNPNYPSDSITFRMVMAHVSSINDNDTLTPIGYYNHDSPVSLDSLMKNYFVPGKEYYSASKNFYNYPPGTQYNYSNVGAALLGYLVQRISGMPFDQYCKIHIFDSLCMDHTSWFLSGITDTTLIARPYSLSAPATYSDDGLYGYAYYPCGQLRTNITAMMRFQQMYLHHGIYNGNRILDSATVDTILSPQFQSDPNMQGQGLILYETYYPNGDSTWGHAGGDDGVSTEMQFSYKYNMGLIMFSNGDGFNAGVDTLLDTIYSYAITTIAHPSDTFPTTCTLTGVNEVPAIIKTAEVYPNPANTELTIKMEQSTEKLAYFTMFNALGQRLKRMEIKDEFTTINVSDLPTGLYYYRIMDETGNVLRADKEMIVR